MKSLRTVLAAACCLLAVSASAAVKPKVAGTPLGSLTIVYPAAAEPEEGAQIADYLNAKLPQKIAVSDDSSFKGTKAIRFTHSAGMGVWEYSIKAGKKGLTIDAGGCWAMQKAATLVAEALASGSVPTTFTVKGSVEGEHLFPLSDGADLRILDDNIWDYSKDTIPPVWQKLGYDCRDCNRGPQFAQMVRAYMPDVLTIQEYNKHMDDVFYPIINGYGYVNAANGLDGRLIEGGIASWNNTPIFYNKATVELVDAWYCLYTPLMWSNKGSKSFTAAVFKRISDGKVFAVLNTHLWWKSDKAQPGSQQARAAQVRLMLAEAAVIKGKYNCPIFVTGDMNCEEKTTPIQQFISEGFVPCYKAATVYGNTENGHHICAPGDGYSRTSRRVGPTREVGAIDHCLIGNAGATEIRVFDCLTPAFTVPLTDHYPNLIDARL